MNEFLTLSVVDAKTAITIRFTIFGTMETSSTSCSFFNDRGVKTMEFNHNSSLVAINGWSPQQFHGRNSHNTPTNS